MARHRKSHAKLDFGCECSTADKAALARLEDENLVRQSHAEIGLGSGRTFIHLRGEADRSIKMESFDLVKPDLERELATIFVKQGREERAEVRYFRREREHIFIVRRADPVTKQLVRTPSGMEPISSTPVAQDIIVYNEQFGTLRMDVATEWQKESYSKIIGDLLFGDSASFSEQPVFTLQPLVDHGPEVLEASAYGMESITLQYLASNVNGATNDLRVRKSNDVFESYAMEGGLPEGEELVDARFLVRFEDSPMRKSSFAIQPPYRAVVSLDEGGAKIMAWMSEKGFMIPQELQGKPEPAQAERGTLSNPPS